MPAHRYFVDAALFEGGDILIEGAELNHLKRVMRAQLDDSIELVNGKGFLAEAHIVALEKRSALVKVAHLIEERSSLPEVILAFPITQMSKLDWIVEKGCELGAKELWLYPAELSEKTSLTPTQQERLKQLAIAAMKQCGRLDLPPLKLLPPLAKWPPFQGAVLFGDTRKNAPPIQAAKGPTLIVTGPEKGFSCAELKVLENTLSATGVRLHPYTLRMETAPLVALLKALS